VKLHFVCVATHSLGDEVTFLDIAFTITFNHFLITFQSLLLAD